MVLAGYFGEFGVGISFDAIGPVGSDHSASAGGDHERWMLAIDRDWL